MNTFFQVNSKEVVNIQEHENDERTHREIKKRVATFFAATWHMSLWFAHIIFVRPVMDCEEGVAPPLVQLCF
jgi:hypothetical protein